jgi:hypothetical protein
MKFAIQFERADCTVHFKRIGTDTYCLVTINTKYGDWWDGGGVSRTHPRDKFNKDLGRRIALAKAIQGLPRDLRQVIFAAYEGEVKRVQQI